MAQIDCTIEIDSDSKEIFIKNLQDSPIEIDYSSDIDLTDMVSILCDFIDQRNTINFNILNFDENDEKLKLIINTIKDILTSYNKLFEVEEERLEDNIPDDLPFQLFIICQVSCARNLTF